MSDRAYKLWRLEGARSILTKVLFSHSQLKAKLVDEVIITTFQLTKSRNP